jgi:hypothetical protein
MSKGLAGASEASDQVRERSERTRVQERSDHEKGTEQQDDTSGPALDATAWQEVDDKKRRKSVVISQEL